MDLDKIDSRFEEDLKQLDAQLTNLSNAAYAISRDVSVKNLDITESYELKFLDCKKKAIDALRYAEECLRMRASTRKDVTDKYNFTYISLGYDCLPRTLAAKYGIIPSRKAGRLTGPFDLAVHPLPAVIKLLSDNFTDYDSADYEITNGNTARLKKLNILFNHDQIPQYFENDFKILKEVYLKRAKNFQTYAQKEHLLFVANIRPQDYAFLPSFCDLISKKYPKAMLVLLFTKTPPNNLHQINANTKTIISLIPRDNYSWFMINDFGTPEGMAFEHNIITTLVDIIKTNFPLRS